jgi:hypothetical protein
MDKLFGEPTNGNGPSMTMPPEMSLLLNVAYKLNTVTYRVYQKNRNLGISQEIDIVLKTKDFRRLGM